MKYAIFLLSLGIISCTVQRPPVAAPPMPTSVVAPAPTPPPPPPVIEPPVEVLDTLPPQDPNIVKVLQQHAKTGKFSDISTTAIVKYVFQAERIYTLKCPEWGVLTIRLLPGEVLRRIAAGNPVEWMIEDTSSGLDLESSVIVIRRAPYAEPTQMTAITDVNIYEFLLLPGGELGNGRTRQVSFYDPEAELRRWQGQQAADEQRRKKRAESRLPALSFEHVREYRISGDPVAWRPLRVVGDHQHTMVELPAATGSAQPTLSVMDGGIETRINVRTIPGRGDSGPVIVVDQPLSEAQLSGEGGIVYISGRGN